MNTDFLITGLLEALLARGIAFRRQQSDPNEIWICCPFCSDTKFRLGANIRTELAHCFNCDWRSRQATKDLSEAMDLGVLVGTGPAVGIEIEKEVERPALPEDFKLLAAGNLKGKLEHQALAYMRGRQVPLWQLEEKKVGVSFCGAYSYRIVFPVFYGSKLQGLVTRDFTGKQEPKYRNSPGMKAVYNSPVKKKNKAVLCEGVFDCLALERTLPKENCDILALLGHGLTDQQEERLEDYRDIILWPDADVPGVKGFMDIGMRLAQRHRLFVVPPISDTKDAGEMAVHELSYMWATRTRLTSALALKLRAEAEFRE